MRTQNSYTLGPISKVSQTDMKPSESFRNATVTMIAEGGANLTIKAFASNQKTQPDLSVVASAENQYSEVQMTELNGGGSIDGTTGVVLSSDGITRYEVNDNNNRWIGFKVTAYTAGSVSAGLDMSDNS